MQQPCEENASSDCFSLFSFQTRQLLKLSVASEQHQEAMEHCMNILLISRAII